MLLEKTVKNYWIIILIVMAFMIIDVGATAVLIIQENPTTREVRNDKVAVFEEHQVKLQEQLVGTHIEWENPPSDLLKTTESLMIPSAMAFLLTCMVGMVLKIIYEERQKIQA